VQQVDDHLMPEELDCVRNAVETRRAQFGTGRLCARRALSLLGIDSTAPLTVAPGGLPRWPEGVVGSITHTSSYCAVVVKRRPPWLSVGLDAEDLRSLDCGVLDLIATESEQRWLDSLPTRSRDGSAVLLFSAKEAFFKLQYPLTKRFLEFRDVEIVADPAAGTFRAIPRLPMTPALFGLSGRFTMAAGKVLCGIELR
jgi:4'-phosphopantetheinyl transferase EntD